MKTRTAPPRDSYPEAMAATATDDALIGRVIDDRYRILGRLGAGGMGIVYEATHAVLGTRLALKVLLPSRAADANALERLRREAQAASAVGSEHIVDVRDFGQLDDGSTYVVMERIDGDDLQAVLNGGRMPWRRARGIAVQLCEALSAAHAQGIVHRDLKPENVLITARRDEPDFVKIVDFGIAKVQGGAKITAAGHLVGTPEYMAPEQCAGERVDHRADIYALGVMLYEMTTGELPFDDEDLMTLLRRQRFEAPAPPSSLQPELPRALDEIVLRCLAKDAGERFQSTEALRDALLAIERAERPADPPAAPPGRRWRAFGLLALAMAGLAGAGLLAAAGRQPARRPNEPIASEPIADEPIADEPIADEPSPPSTATAPPALEPPPPITVETSPPTARVFSADGAYLGHAPLPLPRPAEGATLAIELRAPGYAAQSVTLSHLSEPRVRIRLSRVERRAPPRAPAARPEPTAPVEPQGPPPPPRRHQELRDPWH